MHLREPVEHSETIGGARAAAAGGSRPSARCPTRAGERQPAVTTYIIERHGGAVNVFPIGDRAGAWGRNCGHWIDARRCVAISTTRPVMNAQLMRAPWSLRAASHAGDQSCEDLHLSAGGGSALRAWNQFAGLRGIPGCWGMMVARDILLAEVTGARYHVARISSVILLKWWLREAQKDSQSHRKRRRIITLTDASAVRSNYKMKPPLRSASDVNAVVEGVVGPSAIATDHAPHAGSEKMQEFEVSVRHHWRNRAGRALRTSGS
jgi:dihydroorotase